MTATTDDFEAAAEVEVERLRREVKVLRLALAVVIAQRDFWKRVAEWAADRVRP